MAGMTTLAEALGSAPAFDKVVEALAAGLGDALGVQLAPAGLSPEESALVDALVAGKYGTDVWTMLGHLPEQAGAPAGVAG